MTELANFVNAYKQIKNNVLFSKSDIHIVCAVTCTLFYTDNFSLHMLSTYYCVACLFV